MQDGRRDNAPSFLASLAGTGPPSVPAPPFSGDCMAKVVIGGEEFEVISHEEAMAEGEITSVVCVELTNPLLLPDNMVCFCALCTKPLQHRPSNAKIPRKICEACAETERMTRAKEGVKTVSAISPETLEYLKKKLQGN